MKHQAAGCQPQLHLQQHGQACQPTATPSFSTLLADVSDRGLLGHCWLLLLLLLPSMHICSLTIVTLTTCSCGFAAPGTKASTRQSNVVMIMLLGSDRLAVQTARQAQDSAFGIEVTSWVWTNVSDQASC